MQERTCKCGTKFTVDYPSSNRLNCSAKCRGMKGKRRSDAGIHRVDWLERRCPCGVTFEVPPWAKERGGKKYCSMPCRATYAKVPPGRPAQVKSRRRLNDQGYMVVYLPPEERPPGSTRAHQPEHRVVMSRILGRHLLPDENVHHINGIKTDNRPENLELWTTKQPRGQRAADLLAFAHEIIARYESLEDALMAVTTTNKDGSVTTSDEDQFPADVEAKVVEPQDEKPRARTRSTAESK